MADGRGRLIGELIGRGRIGNRADIGIGITKAIGAGRDEVALARDLEVSVCEPTAIHIQRLTSDKACFVA
jgi:hypothetical protein